MRNLIAAGATVLLFSADGFAGGLAPIGPRPNGGEVICDTVGRAGAGAKQLEGVCLMVGDEAPALHYRICDVLHGPWPDLFVKFGCEVAD